MPWCFLDFARQKRAWKHTARNRKWLQNFPFACRKVAFRSWWSKALVCLPQPGHSILLGEQSSRFQNNVCKRFPLFYELMRPTTVAAGREQPAASHSASALLSWQSSLDVAAVPYLRLHSCLLLLVLLCGFLFLFRSCLSKAVFFNRHQWSNFSYVTGRKYV